MSIIPKLAPSLKPSSIFCCLRTLYFSITGKPDTSNAILVSFGVFDANSLHPKSAL